MSTLEQIREQINRATGILPMSTCTINGIVYDCITSAYDEEISFDEQGQERKVAKNLVMMNITNDDLVLIEAFNRTTKVLHAGTVYRYLKTARINATGATAKLLLTDLTGSD